jgi:hypothetical protein
MDGLTSINFIPKQAGPDSSRVCLGVVSHIVELNHRNLNTCRRAETRIGVVPASFDLKKRCLTTMNMTTRLNLASQRRESLSGRLSPSIDHEGVFKRRAWLIAEYTYDLKKVLRCSRFNCTGGNSFVRQSPVVRIV